MKYLKTHEEIGWKDIPENGKPYRKLKVDKYPDGYCSCEFRCELGRGSAEIAKPSSIEAYSNDQEIEINLKDNEMYIGGIGVKPLGKGIGQIFLRELFDYFKVDRFYLSSMNHPVWKKIATDTGYSTMGGCTLFTLTKDQLK